MEIVWAVALISWMCILLVVVIFGPGWTRGVAGLMSLATMIAVVMMVVLSR
jgi:hypothetical protein